MSASGYERTSSKLTGMSAFRPKADIAGANAERNQIVVAHRKIRRLIGLDGLRL
jgi:hypothetical protein